MRRNSALAPAANPIRRYSASAATASATQRQFGIKDSNKSDTALLRISDKRQRHRQHGGNSASAAAATASTIRRLYGIRGSAKPNTAPPHQRHRQTQHRAIRHQRHRQRHRQHGGNSEPASNPKRRNSASAINGKSDTPNVDIRDGSKSETALLRISDKRHRQSATATRRQFGARDGNKSETAQSAISVSVKSDTAQSAISDKRHRQSATRRQFGARDSNKSDTPNVDIKHRNSGANDTSTFTISDSVNGIGNTVLLGISATAKPNTAQFGISDKRHRQSATRQQTRYAERRHQA